MQKHIQVQTYVKRKYQPPAGYRVMHGADVVTDVRYRPYEHIPMYPPYQIVNEHGAVCAELHRGDWLDIEAINE